MVDVEPVRVERAPGAEGESEFEESYDDWRDLRGSSAALASLGDAFGESLGAVPRRALVTVEIGTSVAETIRAMNESHVGCALVVRDGRLAGIFTERDVLTKVAGGSIDAGTTPIEQVMTPDPDTLPANASVAYALHKMSIEGYRHVPLVDDARRPVGVVAVRDIVAWLCDLFPQAVMNLPPEPSYPRSVDGA